MSFEELRVRLGQEMWKRYDLARYRLGLADRPLALDPNVGITGKFFFAEADIPARIKLLSGSLPEDAAAIVAEADNICRHHFCLLGYQDLDYGPVIDWHRDAVSGKRAPLQPWFKIPFLDYAAVGDHKVIWELNRHQHLVTLAKAWRLTGDQKYLDQITSQWQSWQLANPYPLGINWASSLEVAFRSLSWLWVLALLADCPQCTPAFRLQVTCALAFNARYIERYLSTYFSPNTHLLGEAAALFFIGVLCPQLPAAARWRSKGWQILLREAQRQVRGDGVYFEQSLYYHVYALDFFLHARILADRNGSAVPKAFDEKINQMLDVLQFVGQAGPVEGFGDDDGGRVFNPRRNRAEHLSDPFTLGALFYGRGLVTNLTEEAIWLFGDRAASADRKPSAQGEIQSHALPDGGIYLLADSVTNMQLVIDAGPQGTGRSGHGHADALSVVLSGRGRCWLIDSGTGRYISNANERELFRGTAAHNTMRVDGFDQAVPQGPFAWSKLPQVKSDRWIVGDSFALFEGSHSGYTRLPNPVTHRRFVFLLKGNFWLVRDVAEGTGQHDLEIFWHFAPDLKLRNVDCAVVAEPAVADASGEAASIVMQTSADPVWSSSLEFAPVSPAYGRTCPAPLLCQRACVRLPADSASLLIPHSGYAQLGNFFAVPAVEAAGVRAYRYQLEHHDHYFFYSQADQPWDCGPWSSDAQFLYCRLEGGRLAHLILAGGQFCKWHDTELVTLSRRVQRFEWLRSEGNVTSSSSDDSAIRHLLANELTCSGPVV